MIIGIDGKPLTIDVPCGLKEYAWQLITHLSEIDKVNTYYIFLPKHVSLPRSKNIIPIVGEKRLWQLELPRLVKQHPTQVFHFLHQHGAILLHHRNILTTVHDIADRRAYLPIWKNIRYGILGWYVPFVRDVMIRKSKRLIIVTEAMKKDVVRKYPKHEQSTVIPDAWDPYFSNGKDEVRNKLLHFSDFSPRKNTYRVIEAYSKLPWDFRRKYPLHIIYSMDFLHDYLATMIQQCSITGEVSLHFQPSRSFVRELYAQSVLLLYPSLYEGFGLPILEAMGSGCPVLTSNYGATKEVAGKAAQFVNPHSVSDIMSGILAVTGYTAQWKKLQTLGRENASKYSWMHTAKQTKAVYESMK